jgi:hypothetical protein
MCWRDIIFTADGMILPPSWPAWIPEAVRHEHALARARCISEEERVLLDALAQTKSRLPTNANGEANSEAVSIATTPAMSRCSSVCAAPGTNETLARCNPVPASTEPSGVV